MYSPYNESICKQCPFKGEVVESRVGTTGIKFINCQRDNKDSQEHFIRTNKNESLLLWIRQADFLHCLFSKEIS